MSLNLQDHDLFDDGSDDRNIQPRSILSSRKFALRLFPRLKKRVKFAESAVSTRNGSRNVQEKWRKYVAEQFTTLRSRNKKRDRWLGRGGKTKRKGRSVPVSQNGSSINSAHGEGPSGGRSLDASSSDVLETFAIPEPDHKKRKKNSSKRSRNASNRNSNKRLSPKSSNTQTNKKRKQKVRKSKSKSQSSPSSTSPGTAVVQDGGDPNAFSETNANIQIKRPLNAFMLFSQSCRNEFREMLVPAFDSQVVSMVLGHIWRFMSKAERQSFYQDAKIQQDLYYEQKRGGRPQSDANQPGEAKRPLNAFLLFCQDLRVQLQGRADVTSTQRNVRMLAQRWRRLKPREKQAYFQRAERERALYLKEKESSKQGNLWNNLSDNTNDPTGDIAVQPARVQKLKRLGKNNNKWLADSSDTDGGSQPNSTTLIKPADEALETAVTDPPPGSGSEAPGSSSSSSREPKIEQEDPDAFDTDSESELDENELDEYQPNEESSVRRSTNNGVTVRVQSASAESEEREEGAPSRRRRRRRKRRRVSRRRRMDGKQVRWRDESSPWDVFDPLACVLCDEDICSRLYSPARSRDDSCLQAASASPHPTSPACCPCAHHSRNHVGIRHSLSCSTLGVGRRQIEEAFLKPELDLATLSSSTSSECDLCPWPTVPSASPSSSGVACLQYRLSDFNISTPSGSQSSGAQCPAPPSGCVVGHTSEVKGNSSHSAIPSSCTTAGSMDSTAESSIDFAFKGYSHSARIPKSPSSSMNHGPNHFLSKLSSLCANMSSSSLSSLSCARHHCCKSKASYSLSDLDHQCTELGSSILLDHWKETDCRGPKEEKQSFSTYCTTLGKAKDSPMWKREDHCAAFDQENRETMLPPNLSPYTQCICKRNACLPKETAKSEVTDFSDAISGSDVNYKNVVSDITIASVYSDKDKCLTQLSKTAVAESPCAIAFCGNSGKSGLGKGSALSYFSSQRKTFGSVDSLKAFNDFHSGSDSPSMMDDCLLKSSVIKSRSALSSDFANQSYFGEDFSSLQGSRSSKYSVDPLSDLELEYCKRRGWI